MTYRCALTILIISLLYACGTSTNSKVDEVKGQTAKAIEQEVEKEPEIPTPQIGKERQFFLEYGEKNPETRVLLKTRLGDIEIRLYEETPIHRSNFIYNIKQELYYKTIFYRVVPDFMIQGGNSDNDQTIEKREAAGAYYIPNETNPKFIHKRGAIAMAMSYEDNPDLKSAQYSYYIVIGKRLDDGGLDAVEKEYGISIAPAAREVYKAEGGTPHLDNLHTVFGEVVRGMDVVEAISNENRDSGDWPINDVVIDYEILE